ncbi:hypothetical protein EV127DRAFT_437600 [Xylaria flabelliformis]|nr:hypothetical protein EV127DRAFT_437600 [Xylaria flabelliformis]
MEEKQTLTVCVMICMPGWCLGHFSEVHRSSLCPMFATSLFMFAIMHLSSIPLLSALES